MVELYRHIALIGKQKIGRNAAASD